MTIECPNCGDKLALKDPYPGIQDTGNLLCAACSIAQARDRRENKRKRKARWTSYDAVREFYRG